MIYVERIHQKHTEEGGDAAFKMADRLNEWRQRHPTAAVLGLRSLEVLGGELCDVTFEVTDEPTAEEESPAESARHTDRSLASMRPQGATR